MMSTIRGRIFFPLVLLIVLFPVLSWALFSATSDWYMDRSSRQSLDVLMDSVSSMAEEVYGDRDLKAMTRDQEKIYSRELLGRIKGYIRKGQPEARLMAFNSRMKLTYPRQADYQTDTAALSVTCGELIAEGAFHGKDAVTVSVGSRRYMAGLHETESRGNIRGKYLVGYVEIPDTRVLLSYTGGLLLLIAGSLAALSMGGAWLIASSISKPLRALCGHAGEIGGGSFAPANEHYPVAEIEELKDALNRMTSELEQMEQRQLIFFQNASHELRTPLMSICGYAQGIQCNVFPDYGQAASVILSETMRMKELVDGILTISKLDSHDFELRTGEVCLNDFLEEQMDILRGVGITEKVNLDFGDMPENPVMVKADMSLLSKAFRNVVSNCARYAAGRVTVSLEEGDVWHAICVEDDGPGFDEKDFPHIFERFYKGSQGNFGIGLSITRSSMEYMGGRVEAENRQAPSHGAIFRLFLPRHDVRCLTAFI